MPQPNNNIKDQQWDMCGQCGQWFPMGDLTKQQGLLVCTRGTCFDDLTPNRRGFMIEQIFNDQGGWDVELTDRRQLDKGFFEGYDETNR
jgi:hypothetical protein